METVLTQVRIDMSSTMNMFLRQCVMREGLPFVVEIPQYRPEVLEAMEEARRISKDPNTKRYGVYQKSGLSAWSSFCMAE